MNDLIFDTPLWLLGLLVIVGGRRSGGRGTIARTKP
jgi:hypothetical protein